MSSGCAKCEKCKSHSHNIDAYSHETIDSGHSLGDHGIVHHEIGFDQHYDHGQHNDHGQHYDHGYEQHGDDHNDFSGHGGYLGEESNWSQKRQERKEGRRERPLRSRQSSLRSSHF